MEERLQKIPILKIVLSIFFVIVLTGIPILHISHAPTRVEIDQTAKIAELIILAIAFALTYGIGIWIIIKDVISKFRRRKVDNKASFAVWIAFCIGVILLDMLLGTIWGKLDLRALFQIRT